MIKTKEFIEKVKKLGFEIVCYTNPWSNVESNCKYNSIRIYLHDELLVEVWTNCQYAISTISDGHSCFINGYDVDKLYKLCFEYANTPVMDREEEKKFLIQHKYLVSKNLLPVNLAWNKLKDVYRSINLKVDNHIYQAQFTFKEYEEIKKKLNTDLADYELVEVEDNIIWNDKPFNRGAAWIDLIMLANHENKKIIFNGSMVEIKRGEKITSLRKLSERWGWSRGKTKKFLNLLKDENMIEFKTDHQKTTYKIVNYNVYQNEDLDKRATEKPLNDQQKATEKPLNDTNNNINNYNNVNNNNCVGQSELNLDDPKLAELIKLYENCGFGLISPYSAKVLSDYMDMYSFPWVKEAIQIAEQNNIRTLAYINGILKKKKSGTDKPRNNNFKKKETYYRPKQDDELSEESRNLNNKVLNSFIEKMKKEDAKNGKAK